MLKNWTVTTQAVKNGTDGVMARERYLVSERHPNHKHTEAIISIFGDINTSKRISLAGEQYRLMKKFKSRKGGRPLASFAMEYCLTLPKGIRPSEEQWKLIIITVCKSLACSLELNNEEYREFKHNVRAVCHQQKQNGRSGSGDHIHLILGKIVKGRILTKLQKKEGTRLIKQSFNHAVLTHVGINHKDYKPKELNRGTKVEIWRYQQQKANESLQILKLVNKLQRQSDLWFKALGERDYKQLNRKINRIKKTFDELSKEECTSKTKSELLMLKKHISSRGGKL